MAEGVKFPEKNACFWRFGPPIGGGGRSLARQGRSTPAKCGQENELHCAATHTQPFCGCRVDHPVDRWQTGCSNGSAFITPWNIGICIGMLYPVDRWNECE